MGIPFGGSGGVPLGGGDIPLPTELGDPDLLLQTYPHAIRVYESGSFPDSPAPAYEEHNGRVLWMSENRLVESGMIGGENRARVLFPADPGVYRPGQTLEWYATDGLEFEPVITFTSRAGARRPDGEMPDQWELGVEQQT